MKSINRRSALLIILWSFLPCCSANAGAEPSGAGTSITDQIYQLTVDAKRQVEADSLEAGLATAFSADSLVRSCDGCDDLTAATVYNNIAYCLYRNEQHQLGLSYADSAMSAWQNNGGTPDSLYADIHCTYGRIYQQLSRFDESIENFEKALSIQTTVFGPDHLEVAATSNNLAAIMMWTDQTEQADSLYNVALDIWRRKLGPEHPDVGLCLFNLGVLKDNLGQWDEAEHYYHESLRIRKKALGPDHSSIGVIHFNIAALQETLGKNDSALVNYTKALDIIGESFGKNSVYYAMVLEEIGASLIFDQGEFAAGESHYKDALTIYSETIGLNTTRVAQLYSKRANFNMLFGRYEAALEFATKSCRAYREVYGRNSINHAEAMAQIADIYSAKLSLAGEDNGYAAAIDSLYEEFVDVIDQCQAPTVAAHDLAVFEFGIALINCGRCEEGLRMLRQRMSDSDQPAGVSSVVAWAEMSCGSKTEALALADEIADLIADPVNISLSSLDNYHAWLGEIHLFAGNFEESLEFYKKYCNSHNLFLRTTFGHASQATKVLLLNNKSQSTHLLNLVDKYHTSDALSLGLEHTMMEKSYVLDAISAEHEFLQCSDDPTLRELCDNYSEVSSRAACLVRSGIQGGATETAQDVVHSLIAERDSLETLISNVCGNIGGSRASQLCKIEDVAGRIGSDQLLIEYVRFLSSDSLAPYIVLRRNNQFVYGAFILDSDHNISFYNLGPASVIDSLIDQSRRLVDETGTKAFASLGTAVEQQLRDINRDLYSLIISPFANLMEGKSHLIIAPDRNICLIPFETLPVDDSRYLLEKHSVSYVSSGRDLLSLSSLSVNSDGPIVLFSDPDYQCDIYADIEADTSTFSEEYGSGEDVVFSIFRSAENCSLDGFKRLPYANEEAQSIENLIRNHTGNPTIHYSGNMAREKNLKALNQGLYALHFATHGFVCSSERQASGTRDISPMFQSGLALAGANVSFSIDSMQSSGAFEDGILSAYEASALNLIGTDLVVLSACETGIGEYVNGMGVMGLRSSFRQAGANSVIMSLWKVPDNLSARMMKGFYGRWLSGESKIDALRNTSLALLKDARAEFGNGHPIHWSGFILSGNSQ